MATSPDHLRLGTSATGPIGDIALEAAREAIVIVDVGQHHLPVVLGNAAARRSLLGCSDDRSLLNSSLFSYLGLATESLIDAAVPSENAENLPVVRVISWQLMRGSTSISTELKFLRAPGQRLMMLTFAEPTAETGLLSVIEQLPLDLLILDNDLTVTYANPGAARSAGLVPSKILGLSALTLVPTSVVPREAYDRALEGHHYYDDAVAVAVPGAEMRWFEVDVQPLKEASQIVGLSVLSMEVTERRSRRRAQSGSERRLLALTEHARDIITVAGRDGRLNYVSGGIRNSLGYSAEERHANSIFEHMHPEDVDALRSKYFQLVTGDIGPFAQQYRVRHKDGSFRWFESNYVSALDNPLINGVVVNTRDVTESQLAEHRLAQREEVFRLAADSVDGVIYEWDIASGAVQRSRGVREVLGMEPEDLSPVIDAWCNRIHPQDFAVYSRVITSALKEGRGWTASYRIRDGSNRYRSLFERSLIQRSANGDPVRAIGCCVDVSQTKRLTDLLTETQHAAKMGGWEYFYASREVTWTDETYRIFETTPTDFPLSWDAMLSRFTPESRQGFLDACSSVEREDTALDLELEIITLAGRRVWVRIFGHVEWQEGAPFRSFGSVQNVQAQKRAQVELETTTGWLKLSMNMARMHAWRWEREDDKLEFAVIDGTRGHLPRVFPAMKRLIARIHPKDRLAVRRAIDHAFERHAEVREEFRVRGADGQYRWYAATARPRFNAANQPSGLVGVVQDVTARHESEQRLRRSEELLRATTANTADTLLLLDNDLVIQFINRDVYGISIDNIIGREISILLPRHRRRQVIDRLRHVLQTGERITYEFDRPWEGAATQYYECQAVAVLDKGVGSLSMTVRNITVRKRMEQEILDVASRERQTIGRDLHDGLGQELTGAALMLRGLAKRIQSQCPDSVEQIDEVVQLVNQSIETARALSRGLLPLQTESGGLSDALRELATRGRSLYGFEVTLRTDIAPEVNLSESQASHLYRIAQEALTNAARHSQASSVSIELSISKQQLLLEIADDGAGIPLSGRAASGMGLKIMRYRASIIGAKCEILPNHPHGTVVRVTGDDPAAASASESIQAI